MYLHILSIQAKHQDHMFYISNVANKIHYTNKTSVYFFIYILLNPRTSDRF